MSTALLALEDGTVFEGRSFGARTEQPGEVVFNTAITGYQEIFTDPSYSGQIVVLTNPQIGNYGANDDDCESRKPYIEGLVVREFSPLASNWRSRGRPPSAFSPKPTCRWSPKSTPARWSAICARRGVMRGVLSSDAAADPEELVERARAIPSMAGLDLATRVTTAERYEWATGVSPVSPYRRDLRGRAEPATTWSLTTSGSSAISCAAWCISGCHVTVVPARTTAEDVLALKPDGVFLSNGPGDPEPLDLPGRSRCAS